MRDTAERALRSTGLRLILTLKTALALIAPDGPNLDIDQLLLAGIFTVPAVTYATGAIPAGAGKAALRQRLTTAGGGIPAGAGEPTSDHHPQ